MRLCPSRESPGLSIGKVEDKMGQRSLNVAEVILENVVVPRKTSWEGRRRVQMGHGSPGRRPGEHRHRGLGTGPRRFRGGLSYAKTRVQFGRPIGTHQGLNFMLADMAAAVEAARLLTWYAGSLADQHKRFSREAAKPSSTPPTRL